MTTEPVGNNPRPPQTIPSNSHKSRAQQQAPVASVPKEERVPLERIVEGKVTLRKPAWWKRAARSMVADDVTNVGDYLLQDVFLPNVKRTLLEMISRGAERTLFGSAVGRRGASSAVGPVSSIRSRYERMQEGTAQPIGLTREQRGRHAFNEISLGTREEAMAVLEALHEHVSQYRSASVAELYTLLGTTGSYADQNWGWTDLRTADIRAHRGGWLLDLPAPEVLR